MRPQAATSEKPPARRAGGGHIRHKKRSKGRRKKLPFFHVVSTPSFLVHGAGCTPSLIPCTRLAFPPSPTAQSAMRAVAASFVQSCGLPHSLRHTGHWLRKKNRKKIGTPSFLVRGANRTPSLIPCTHLAFLPSPTAQSAMRAVASSFVQSCGIPHSLRHTGHWLEWPSGQK